jgi:hypothetical protein
VSNAWNDHLCTSDTFETLQVTASRRYRTGWN